MTGFDFIVLGIVGVAAIGGFLRGFVQEMLSLAAWVLALIAIYYLHGTITGFIERQAGFAEGSSAAILAFVLLLLIPYFAMKLIATQAGTAARNSVLGPIDRVLGFGFGALKGIIITVIAFSVLVLGYDLVWGAAGRPAWIAEARTYRFINASSDQLVAMIHDRRERMRAGDSARGDGDNPDGDADR